MLNFFKIKSKIGSLVRRELSNYILTFKLLISSYSDASRMLINKRIPQGIIAMSSGSQ